MRKPFGWDLIVWFPDGLLKPSRLTTFGPFATLERAAYAIRELLPTHAPCVFTVVEVDA